MKKIFLFILFFFITFLNVYADGSFLTAIKIDGKDLEGFESEKLDYSFTVDGSKDKIVLGYIYDMNLYDKDSGSEGTIPLNYGKNELSYTLIKKDDNTKRTYKISIERTDNRKGDNSLTSLSVGNNKVVLTDDLEYTVSVDAKNKSVEVKATLPEGASFVDGYGERTGNNSVELKNETTSIEIKVKAENENIKTYKINITKSNYKSNDATLKKLKIDEIPFDFNSKTFEYDLSVKYNISKIKIEAIKNHELANVEYTENVTLKTGANNIEIKVTAEDGTIKVYKLNITREEEVPIVQNITITGIDFKFKPKTYNYKIETTLDKLDFNITLSNPDATSEIENNENLKNGSIIKIKAKEGENEVTYNFKIINKEIITEDEKENKTVINNNKTNFLKDNEMLFALIIFGIGLTGMLIAVVIKNKNKNL